MLVCFELCVKIGKLENRLTKHYLFFIFSYTGLIMNTHKKWKIIDGSKNPQPKEPSHPFIIVKPYQLI